MKLSALLLLISLVFSEILEDENGVLVITDSNLEEATKLHPNLLVEFYAPWCVHCQHFAPEYAAAAKTLMQEIPPIRIGKLDGTTNRRSVAKFEIEGFPTLKFFVNGLPSDYSGSKDKLGIVSWLKKKINPPVMYLDTADSLSNFLANSEVAVILFTENMQVLSEYKALVMSFKETYFAACRNPTLYQEYRVKDPALVVVKNGVETSFEGNFVQDEMVRFIEKNTINWVIPFDDHAAQLIFGKQIPCLFVFRKDAESDEYKSVVASTASKLKGKILISFADLKDPKNARLVEFFRFDSDWMPFAAIVDERFRKFLMTDRISENSLIEFVRRWEGKEVKPYLQSQNLPEKTYEAGVRVVVGENFEDVVYDKERDVLVMFYAPWCKHCKKLAPEYSKLAIAVKDIETLVVAKIDATQNEVAGFEVEEFPTLKFFPANNKEGISFAGSLNFEEIYRFVQSNSAVSRVHIDL